MSATTSITPPTSPNLVITPTQPPSTRGWLGRLLAASCPSPNTPPVAVGSVAARVLTPTDAAVHFTGELPNLFALANAHNKCGHPEERK